MSYQLSPGPTNPTLMHVRAYRDLGLRIVVAAYQHVRTYRQGVLPAAASAVKPRPTTGQLWPPSRT